MISKSILRWIDLQRPIPIQLDITNSCNLNCRHCYHSHHQNFGALPLRHWLQILEEYAILIRKLNAKPHVIFCGGEPTISGNLQPLLARREELWPEGYHVVIITNATRSSRLSPLLELDPQRISFQVSLDGPSPELHDSYRGTGKFNQTLEGIRQLIDKNFTVSLLAVLSRKNSSEISKFFDLAKSLRVAAMNFTRLIAVGNGETFSQNAEQSPLLPLELKQSFLQIMKHAVRTGVKTQIHSPLVALLHPSLGRSGRFWESLVIDYQGNYLATSRSRITIGHVDNDRMEDILTKNPYFGALVHKQVTTCGSCEFYDRCGGDRNAAFAATGNFLGPDPGCWKHEIDVLAPTNNE